MSHLLIPIFVTSTPGNLTGCLLAPQEMDYLRKEIVSSLRCELRDMLRDALTRALTPTTTMSSHTYYSPTATPNPTPQFASPHLTPSQFSLPAPPCQPSGSCNLPSPTGTTPPLLLVADTSSGGDSCGAQRLSASPQPVARSTPSPVPPAHSPTQPTPSNSAGVSGGVVRRTPQDPSVGAASQPPTSQDILLRPPNESDRVHTHMYTQL